MSISNFVLPAGTTVWFHDLDGHYESTYKRQDIADVKPGQWAGPPVTFSCRTTPDMARSPKRISSTTPAWRSKRTAAAAGRSASATGSRVNYPYELRYGREEAKRLGKPAAITGTITTPWRVVLLGRDLNALVNSDVLPSLCPPADATLFPRRHEHDMGGRWQSGVGLRRPQLRASR